MLRSDRNSRFWRNIVWTVAIVLTISSLAFGCSTSQAVKTGKIKDSVAKTIDDSALKLVVKECGYCRTLAPESWVMVCDSAGNGCDISSPDKKMHAGYFIAFVYSSMYPTIDDFINNSMLIMGYKNASLDSETDFGYGFTSRDFKADVTYASEVVGTRGRLFYKKYDAPELGGYIVSTYLANTTSDIWDLQGAIPSFSAISIRCVSQLKSGTSTGGTETGGSDTGGDLSDKWQEAIMGYENVYSTSTGEHFEVPINSKWEAGPEGPGYYRDLPGGGYEKLESGFGDY
jgi:hypothetical protein